LKLNHGCEIFGSHDGVANYADHLGCYGVLTVKYFRRFRGIIVP